MRNLKKFLALVMAMVMAFSLMLTVNAANPVKTFDDAGSITEEFVEAADVLTGMKVFQGDEGGFRPGDSITRAEVAALIYRLTTGDTGTEKMDLYTTTHPFTDVAAGDWFAGYVGYCWNAGYIKGTTATTFNPYDSVTGYETLAMVLRAMGYDANGEFTGNNWIVNVSATAQQRGLLDDVKTTHYGNTLHLASRRDVVASILFQAAQKTRVKYTPAFGYQSGDYNQVDSTTTGRYNDYTPLGVLNFGLTYANNGVVIGNQQTGEKNTRLGWAGTQNETVDGTDIAPAISYTAFTWEGRYDVSALPAIGVGTADDAKDAILGDNDIFNVETGIDLFGHKVKIWFDGRGSSYDSTKGRPVYAYFDKAKTDVVYADNTDLTLVNADSTVELAEAIGGTELKVASSKKAVFSNSFGKFGTLATAASVSPDGTDADEFALAIGDGMAKDGRHDNGFGTAQYDEAFCSPVGLYKIISNNKDNTVDAVIALNIESSQVTESNAVNRVPTIGLPVYNWATNPEAAATGANFIEGVKGSVNSDTAANQKNKNLKDVGGTLGTTQKVGVITGVLAKDALVGNSASALGDYEMGIHITGTTRRNISTNEATAINNNAATKDQLESSYFLLNKVTATVEGRVVSYNRAAGTVTLDNGTVLERSKFYNTVVVTNPKDGTNLANKVSATQAPISAIPQGWVYDNGMATPDAALDKWVEGYANETYKFYTDYEGKYLGAERSYGASFLYGTYLDYDQKTSTSTFNYYLTGVTLNGEIETKQVSKFWAGLNQAGTGVLHPSNATAPSTIEKRNITGTDQLGIPFRDTYGTGAGSVNGLGVGLYTGVTINGDTVDSTILDSNFDRNEYLMNMARLGIKYAGYVPTTAVAGAGVAGNANAANPAFDIREIDISKDDITLGARETINAADIANATGANATLTAQTNPSNKYFTEATKFILVEGFGTDSVKAEVYNGISELKGSASHVFIKMNGNDTTTSSGIDTKIKLNSAWSNAVAANLMTYYTESPYTYAQSGDTAMKIDTIILPKEAVSWSGGSGLYYVGNPGYSSINSWGTDAWKYDLYEDGELKQVWLTNNPAEATGHTGLADGLSDYADKRLVKDSFLNLEDTGLKANDGEPIYTAGNYSAAGVFTAGTYVTCNNVPTRVANGTADAANKGVCDTNQYTMSSDRTDTAGVTITGAGVRYSAVTRDAQTATFSTYNGTADSNNLLYRVADAKVVNLNKGAKATTGAIANVSKCQSGEIWPNITDLATLNEAGSISPVTGRALKVAAVVDPNNPLVVTTIYVCWEQDWN